MQAARGSGPSSARARSENSRADSTRRKNGGGGGACDAQPFCLPGTPDPDLDGVTPADNCPYDANADQRDSDLDGPGDACDPVSLDQITACFVSLAEMGDSDGDGEIDVNDACPNTPAGEMIDSAGCSHQQFCTAIAANTAEGNKNCRNAAWRNDEPATLIQSPDCNVLGWGASALCVVY